MLLLGALIEFVQVELERLHDRRGREAMRELVREIGSRPVVESAMMDLTDDLLDERRRTVAPGASRVRAATFGECAESER